MPPASVFEFYICGFILLSQNFLYRFMLSGYLGLTIPDSRIEAHIHAVVWAPGDGEPYFINEFVFDDDPFVNARYRAVEAKKGKESSVVKLRKNPEGVWIGDRDIVLKK